MEGAVLLQVVPVVSLNVSQSNGRQLGTPSAWPLPGSDWTPSTQLPEEAEARVSGFAVDASLGSGPYSTAVTIVGGRRRGLMGSPAGERPQGALQARRMAARRFLADNSGSMMAAPAMAPAMKKAAVKPGEIWTSLVMARTLQLRTTGGLLCQGACADIRCFAHAIDGGTHFELRWVGNEPHYCAGLRGAGVSGDHSVTVIIGGNTASSQRSGQDSWALGDPSSAPMLAMAPSRLAAAPAGLVPQLSAGVAAPGDTNATANQHPPPRPYGTPVPGGVLIGADISMQIRVRTLALPPLLCFQALLCSLRLFNLA